MWAAGCIFAELLNLKPLFPGDNDIDQLNRVIRTLGTADESTWPGISGLPDYEKIIFAPCEKKPWASLLPGASKGAVELLDELIR
jgi:serine/threonine protein kinase